MDKRQNFGFQMSLTVISVPFKECKTMNGRVQENKKTKNLKHFIFIVCSKDISWSENFIKLKTIYFSSTQKNCQRSLWIFLLLLLLLLFILTRDKLSIQTFPFFCCCCKKFFPAKKRVRVRIADNGSPKNSRQEKKPWIGQNSRQSWILKK